MVAIVLAAAAALGLPVAGKRPVGTRLVPTRTARGAAVFFGGLFAGFLLAVLVLELALRGVDASLYTQVRHLELAGLDVLATATLLPALLVTAFLVVTDIVRGRTSGRAHRLTVTALALLALVFAVSVLVNVPINTAQLAWVAPAPPPDWASTRDLWQLSHVARTGAAVLALGCLSAAAVSGDGRTATTAPSALP